MKMLFYCDVLILHYFVFHSQSFRFIKSIRNRGTGTVYYQSGTVRNTKLIISSDELVNTLQLALNYGHEDVLNIILKNFTSIYGIEYQVQWLHAVCLQTNNSEVMKSILEIVENIKIDEMDDDGLTLLHIAIMNNNKDMLRLFLKYSPNILIGQYGTALDLAAIFNNTEFFSMLLEYYGGSHNDVDLRLENSDGLTLLQRLSVLKRKDIISILLNFEATNRLQNDPNRTFIGTGLFAEEMHLQYHNNKYSLFDICVLFDEWNILAELLTFNPALITKNNKQTMNALYYAIHHEKIEILELLLNYSANNILMVDISDGINLFDLLVTKPKLFQIYQQYIQSIKDLENDILTKFDSSYMTNHLRNAVVSRNIEAIKLLISLGADVGDYMKPNLRIIIPCLVLNDVTLTETIAKYTRNQETISDGLITLLLMENFELASILCSACEPDTLQTIFIQICTRNLPYTIRFLLDHGADPNRCLPNSCSNNFRIKSVQPIIAATSSGSVEVIKILLEYGANLNLPVTDEDTEELFTVQDIVYRKGNNAIRDLIDNWTVNILTSNQGNTTFVIDQNPIYSPLPVNIGPICQFQNIQSNSSNTYYEDCTYRKYRIWKNVCNVVWPKCKCC